MRTLIKVMVIWMSGFLPFAVWASLPIQHEVGEARTQNWRWPFLLDKLVNNRMPQSYYDFLASYGVYSVEQMINLDDTIKVKLLKMYKDDLVIMAGGNSTRSIW